MSTLFKKFVQIFTHDEDHYLLATDVLDRYKMIARKPTQATMIRDLNLDYIAIIRRSKNAALIGTIANIDILNGFRSWSTVHIYVKSKQVKRNKALMKLIDALPDINPDYHEEPDLEEEKAPVPSAQLVEEEGVTDVSLNGDDEYPIIVLQDHEKFRDAETDEIVEIETRGAREQDKILFKAKDVEAYYALNRLVDIMLNDRTSQYQVGRDYAIVSNARGNTDHRIPVIEESPAHSDEGAPKKQKYIKHDRVYLTLAGLLRVSMVSQSKNANLMKTVNWMIRLFYVHQFGSANERMDLAAALTSFRCLHKIPGLYLVFIGKVKDLRDTMNICEEEYPPGEFNSAYVCKFGLTDDIQRRVTEHQNSRSGYGRYSKTVQLHWCININESVLGKAEQNLSKFFDKNGMKFQFTDEHGVDHKELVIIKPGKERLAVKEKYLKIIQKFPSRENELLQTLSDTREQFETSYRMLESDMKVDKERHARELLETKLDMEVTIAAKDRDIAAKDRDIAATEHDAMAARHETEILKLRLEMAEMKLALK
jgi:predicted GIY-YIG superfamily endonuclease